MKTCCSCKQILPESSFYQGRRQSYNCKPCNKKVATAFLKAHPEKRRAYALKKLYKITIKEVENLLLKQDNKCAICGTSDFGMKGPHVDHNHETSEVRGVLCSNCNHLLGNAKDNVEILSKAVDYLNRL